jgi:tetratricopeptide (TPR) repeat protein
MQLAWAHFTLFWNGFSTDTAADLRKTGELTRSVLAHDNLSPQVKKLAHWLFAWVLLSEGDFPRALREADTAVAFSPYDGIMHAHLSQLLMQAGEAKKGMDWNELAHPQDPGGLQFQNYNKGLGLRLLGKYEESIAAFKQSFYPEGDTPLNIAIALVRLGRIDEAKAEVRVALKNNPKFTGALFRSSFFYSDPSIPDREVADLAKAGLPEK